MTNEELNSDNNPKTNEDSGEEIKENLEEKEKKNKEAKKKKFSFKTKLIFIESLLIILVVAGAFVYYKTTQEKIERAARFEEQNEQIQEQKKMCQDLLNRSKGDFNKYEYCKELLRVFQ
ncbi:MAG: hypothetical protein GF347_03655 [Candidatus Moranbacteria bacterium]|nr:hypothetical protein [Candidatus Moranbacteria bacterium]